MVDVTRTAALFPGQGSHTENMRADVARFLPELLELAEGELGGDLFQRADEATRFAQPAIYLASVAGWQRLDFREVDAVAGHSLGEVAALVAAEALSPEDGLRLVALRGRLMDEAAELGPPGGMLALLGSTAADRAPAIASACGLVVANDNSPGQVVLSGAAQDLEIAARQATSGGLKAMRLKVAGAFHSPAMTSARPTFEAALRSTPFAKPRVPVLSCLTGRPVGDPRRALLAGLTDPVRWRQTLLALRARAINRFIDVGPGRVLAGLVRRTLTDAIVHSIDSLELELA